ncbi:UNVERIFIED_CONTAM: hypothetical protein ABID98_004336 [Brevibacillus sp. OAP136]|nr:EYxxD motif small membrane protein [Brevibacillus fluminis]
MTYFMNWVGTPAYEWITHNLFVAVLVIGSLAVIGYFVYQSQKDRERSR